MIPVKEHDQDVISSGVSESTSFEISAEDTAHIMTILRDTLYSDKILAVIREYCSNAWDANRMVGKGDVPIRVHLPTLEDQSLRIRDDGPGLSPDDIRRIFTKYGASTKRNSNEAVGMLGIGSKSGFAYSDSFTVSSWHGGRKRVYVAVIDATQKGRIDLLHEEGCLPEETGVEVEIPVRSQDIGVFQTKARGLLCYMEPLPSTNLSPPIVAPDAGERVDDMGQIKCTSRYEERGKWTAVMGCVPYQVDLNQLFNPVNGEHVGKSAQLLTGTVWFDIGSLQVAASREDLKYSDGTRLSLIRRINDIVDEFVRRKLEGIDKLNPWEKRGRARLLSNMGLPLPDGLRKMVTSYINVEKRDLPGIRLLHMDGYRRTPQESGYVSIDDKLRFVIRDDKRTVKGFALGSSDYVVTQEVTEKGMVRVELSDRELKKRLEAMLEKTELTGVPVVWLSSIAWAPPAGRAGATPRDAAKARASVLVYTGGLGSLDVRPSTLWTVEQHKPSDDDIYVVLDSYRVEGDEGFYENLQRDIQLMNGVGITPPKLIGYKRTKSTPVDVAKLKGTEYRKWRREGLAKEFAKVKDVMDCAQMIEYNSHSTYHPYVSSQFLAKELGAGHMITQFADKVVAARTGFQGYSTHVRNAADRLRNDGKAMMNAEKERDMIIRSYPMLKTAYSGVMTGFAGDDRKIWTDYVNLVDEHTMLTVDAGQETKVA